MSISKFAAKVIGDKRRWREYKARVRELPEPYRGAVEAFERYLGYLDNHVRKLLSLNVREQFDAKMRQHALLQDELAATATCPICNEIVSQQRVNGRCR